MARLTGVFLDTCVLLGGTIDVGPSCRPAQTVMDAVADRVAGGRLYDAHIAEIARRSGSGVIVTDNVRHFRGGAGSAVRVLSAAELVAELAAGA